MSNNEIFRQWKAPAFVRQPGNGRVIASPVFASLLAEQPQALDGGAGSVWLSELSGASSTVI